MVDKVRAIIKGKLYLRARDVEQVADIDEVVKAFRIRSFNEINCRRCPHIEERFSREFCLPCDNYNGRIDLAEEVRINNKNYVSFPLGAQRMVERRLGVEVRLDKGGDLREYPPMRKKYKVTIDLYDGSPAPDGTTRINQVKAVDDWLDCGGVGVIRAGARSGKTVLAVAISVKLQLRTLVVIDSGDLINQFYDTYCGDGSRRVCATNIPASRVIVIRKMEDFLKPHDVALISYQKLIRETADARIETFIKGKYGLLIGDEVHGASAQAYADMLLKLAIPCRLGLTATPKRKDGRYTITESIYGPVVVSLDKVGLKPKIIIKRTGRFAGRKQSAWHLLSKMFALDEPRNKMICDEAWAAVDRGHKAVLIPLDGLEHIDTIVDMLNDQAYIRHKKDRKLPEVVAVKVTGQLKDAAREAKFEEFDAADSPFLFMVAQRRIVKQGIDLKRPSCVICPIPMSANPKEGAPLFEQLSYRGSTPYHGKRQPEVVVFADESGILERIINGLLRFEVLRNDVAAVGEKRGIYIVDKSCHDFVGSSSKAESAAYGKLGGVVIRR